VVATFFENGALLDTADFREKVLSNLDMDEGTLDYINHLEQGETFEHSEFWGEYEIKIQFSGTESGLECVFDGEKILLVVALLLVVTNPLVVVSNRRT
jgi:hypothetical protein